MNARILFFFFMALNAALSPHRAVLAAGDPAAGQEKIKACAVCHGKEATLSEEATPKLGGQHPEYIISVLDDYAIGQRKHAGMRTIAAALSKQDREDIGAYLGRFELTEVPIPSGERTAVETKLENCRSCHGDRGQNFRPEIPRLIGQDERYLLKSLKDYQNGMRSNPTMVHVMRNLTDRELAEMAAYYASQKGGLTVLE